MANVVTYQRHWQRRGTAAALAAANEVLYAGEWCLESDTGYVKIGDGVTAWNALDYLPIVAADMPYSNGVSGLTASNVQDAIDELAGGGGGGGGNTDPRMGVIDPAYDMLWKPPTAASEATGASYPWSMNFAAGTFAITSVSGGATAPGVWRLSVTTSTSRVAITQGTVANIAVGAGEVIIPYRFRVPTLSDGTNTFALSIGLANDFSAATERIVLDYTQSANGGAVRLVTTAASTTTVVNGTGAVVAANTWVSGHIAINAAGTQVELYEGTTLIATSTTNIPTAAMLMGAFIAKSAGASARTLDIDYLGPPQITFTTPR
jgi:hypothetical protein